MAELFKREMIIDYWNISWGRDTIHYEPYTEEYGMAEFEICPIWRRKAFWKKKVLVKVLIYPRQQPNAKCFYEIIPSNHYWNGISFGCYFNIEDKVRNQIENPNIWTSYWCKKHKCHSFRFYPPRSATKIQISTSLGAFKMNWK